MTFGFQLHWKTHVAGFAVKEPFSSAHSTYATMFAMVLHLSVVVVKQITLQANIFSETNFAIFAIRLDLLSSVAFRADQLYKLLPIEGVRLSIVVTETTWINFSATWTLKRERETVMRRWNNGKFVDPKFFSFWFAQERERKLCKIKNWVLVLRTGIPNDFFNEEKKVKSQWEFYFLKLFAFASFFVSTHELISITLWA